MYQNSPMPSDKMMKLFIIQAISSFVSHDYDSGLHYLNEIKMTFAEFQSSLSPTLKILAKEIIQSLDMFAPGSDASMYKDVNPETATTPQQENARTPQQEIKQQFQQQETARTPQQEIQQQFQQQAEEVQERKKEEPTSVTANLQDLLERRRARKKKS